MNREIKTNLLNEEEAKSQPIALTNTSIQSLINNKITNKSNCSINLEYSQSIKELISEQIEKVIQWWLKVGAFSYSNSMTNKIMAIFVLLFLTVNIILWAITMPTNGYCYLLDACVLTFQVESLFLYIFAYKYINHSFISHVIDSLTNVDIANKLLNQIIKEYYKLHGDSSNNNELIVDDARIIHERAKSLLPRDGIMIFNNQLKYCSLLVIPAYITGYMITFAEHQSNQVWNYYVMIGNALDFIRYVPQVLHIALVRSFYVTFTVQIDKFRTRYRVSSRFDLKTKNDAEEQESLLPNITANEFIADFEGVIKRYRLLSKQLAAWIAIYLLFNTISFVFFALATISYLVNGSCKDTFDYYYYAHYLIELATFFIGWIFLVLPFCENHRLLSRFVRDLQCSDQIKNVNERIAISQYLESNLEASPFSIYGTKATYSKFFWVLNIVFFTIGLNVISKVSAIV